MQTERYKNLFGLQFSSIDICLGFLVCKPQKSYGPSGCRENLTAEALANECGADLISAKGREQ